MTTKQVDSKGRLTLGAEFAGSLVIVDDSEPGTLVIRKAVAIPEREAWLYRSEKALAAVRRGLEQARNGEFSGRPPDIAADAALTDGVQD
ncbi:MAG TPA: hypothetical protein VFW87_17235 [Pirellulales bacterium]|nr:hypothetical protein [Pirellulales bacterium]